MTIQINNLFPIPIGKVDLPDCITKKEFEYITSLARSQNESNSTTVNKKLFKEPELKRLGTFCEQAAHDFFQQVYAPKNLINLYITQSWANYTEKNQYHHKHQHPNSLISGVLYISSDDDTDRINFYKELKSQYHIPTENFNHWNSESWWFPVKSNTLLLFPSDLTHMVETKKTPGTRISISFNTFFKGQLGDTAGSSELIL
jgi:uncharacterized protein (TIGR02466 family)